MNSSSKNFLNINDAKLYSLHKVTSLNPNAAEFVPSSLRSPSGNNKKVDGAKLHSPDTSVKSVLDTSESNFSNSSDDEAHQYWHHQLPDDITPDFKVMGEEELQSPAGLSLTRLSLNDGTETSTFSATMGSQILGKWQEASPRGTELVHLNERTGYSDLATALMGLGTDPWDRQLMNDDQHVSNGREGDHFDGNPNATFQNDLVNENCGLDIAAVNSVKFLAPQFAGFAVERLSKPQVENGFDPNMNSKTLSASSLSPLDYSAPSLTDSPNGFSKYGGEYIQRSRNTFQSVDQEGFSFLKSSMSGASRSNPDFTSSVRGLPSQDSGHWKHDMNVSMDVIGSNRKNSLASFYNWHGKTICGDRIHDLATVPAAPAWLETGDAVAHAHSEKREDEAQDFARLRNACFKQATQAYMIGNDALAKELCIRGQIYDIQVKEAHEKAREPIYHQRNPVTPELRSYNRGYDPLIDLHGLHVNEAVHLLKHELNILRRTARSAGKRLQVMIYVGTGHRVKDAGTPARLPVAVQQYLVDENFLFSEDQPGLLRVVIC